MYPTGKVSTTTSAVSTSLRKSPRPVADSRSRVMERLLVLCSRK